MRAAGKPSFHSWASSASFGPAPTLSLISGRPSTRHRGLSCPRSAGPRVICSADRQTQDVGRLEQACPAPHPPSPNQNPPKTPQRARKPHGVIIASIPQAACSTQDTSYPSRGAQGRAEGAGRERQPGPPFLPVLRPGLGPGLRVGATWLFRGEAEGRVSGRGATGTAEGRRPSFKALGRPGSWQPRTAEGQAITLRGTENQGISLATDVRRADSTFRAGPKRRNNCGNSKHYQHWSIYALMGSGWFYRSAILRKLPTLTCGKRKETGEGALISTQLQHWKGGSLL